MTSIRTTTTRFCRSAAGVACALVAGRVSADEPRSQKAPADGEREPAGVETVRVRGGSPDRSASDTTKEGALLATTAQRTGSDLLRTLPGVFITQHSGEGKAHQIFLRGFDASHGQDIEISVGGIPVNEVSNIHGQGYADLHFVIPEAVKSIRASYGSADPRQGDFAVAGTVRYTLGLDEPGFTTKATLGSYGTKRLYFGYHPKETTSESFAASEAYDTDGFGPNRAARRASLIAQHVVQLSDDVSMRLLGTFFAGRFDSPGVLREDDIERGRIDRLATYDPLQGGASSRAQMLLDVGGGSLSKRWSVAPFFARRSLSLRQNYTGFLASQRTSGKASAFSDNVQQQHDDTMVGLGASYRRELPIFSKRDSFEFGFFGRADFIDQAQGRPGTNESVDADGAVSARVEGMNLATYVDSALHPLPRLVLRGGVRIDGLAYRTRDETTGTFSGERSAEGFHFGKKLSADLALGKGLHALASFGDGFRSPQARSLADGERAPFVESTGAEIGLRGKHSKIDWFFSGFYTHLSRDLVFDERTARNETGPPTRRLGVAGELSVRPARWLLMSVNATYTDARFQESDARFSAGARLPYVPEFVVRADLVAKHTLGRIGARPVQGLFRYGLQGVFGRPLPYGEFARDVFLVDLGVSARLREFELAFDATNLLDARWYDGAFVYPSNFRSSTSPSLVPTRHVTVGAPRYLFATLSVHL